jgi:hypothetical protein
MLCIRASFKLNVLLKSIFPEVETNLMALMLLCFCIIVFLASGKEKSFQAQKEKPEFCIAGIIYRQPDAK